MSMTEKTVERRLTDGVRRQGGLCYKFVSPGNDGVPDRIIVTPAGEVWFVELKTTVGRLSARQKLQISRLQANHANVAVLYGAEDVDRFLKALGGDAV
ncbi:MAG: VRR-NUC domain-containing protein [Clostridiales bacterium]|nr:VRR-NUC domain-containing protein [Clostridiales bacterium]